jgi:hypothetical protein
MLHHSRSPSALIFLIIIAVFQVTKCSHVEISKAENLELNQQKVKGISVNFMIQKSQLTPMRNALNRIVGEIKSFSE